MNGDETRSGFRRVAAQIKHRATQALAEAASLEFCEFSLYDFQVFVRDVELSLDV
jgi:hypothetical protein